MNTSEIIITLEKLKIYNEYKGDVDGFTRVGKSEEKELVDDKTWCIIDDAQQNVSLLATELCSDEYIFKTLSSLRKSCDYVAFNALCFKIPFFNSFQIVGKIVTTIKDKMHSSTDISWTAFNQYEDLIADIDQDINNIQACSYNTLKKIDFSFAPTGLYQELSISNGWGEEYLHLSTEFDNIYKHLISLRVKSR